MLVLNIPAAKLQVIVCTGKIPVHKLKNMERPATVLLAIYIWLLSNISVACFRCPEDECKHIEHNH